MPGISGIRKPDQLPSVSRQSKGVLEVESLFIRKGRIRRCIATPASEATKKEFSIAKIMLSARTSTVAYVNIALPRIGSLPE